MIKNTVLASLLLISISGIAQVNENMLMERFNMNAFNPAYVGSEGRETSFTTRSNWQGIAGFYLSTFI